MAHTQGMLQPRVWRPPSRLLGILTISQTCMEFDRLAFNVHFLSYLTTACSHLVHATSAIDGGGGLQALGKIAAIPRRGKRARDWPTSMHWNRREQTRCRPPDLPLPDQLLI